ncbi:MAG: ABC transporter substrate-binding protein [Lachnospiraceae bacterium]|nr:ABC transporter substrate-binding protein [Lachnospiraceae bacterium]
MRNYTKKFLVMLLVSLMATALCACAGGKAGSANADSLITIGIPQDLDDSLDPHIAEGAGTREVLFNVFEGLVKPNSNGDLIPAVASDYSINEDGTVYTFTLREGVKFHNGKTVTVQDVKASLDKCAGTESGEPLVAAFSAVKEVNTPDDKTIEVVLNEPDTDFLPNMTAAILPADHLDASVEPIGTGPYKYVSRSPQENIVLESFDDYWGEKAKIKNVVLKIVADADTIVMNLEGGSIDLMARLSTTQAAQLSDKFDIYEGTMNLVQAVYLNNAVEPFNDPKVRQALCYAVDIQQIMDFVSDGKGTETGSSMFPAFGKYYMKELNDIYNTDTAKAKQLLAEAGYPDGFTFTISVPSNYQQHVDTAQVIKEQLKEIGVTANINLIEWDSWLNDVYIGRNFEATVVGVDASTLTASAMLGRFVSDSGKNFINYNNPEYDAAYAVAFTSTDDDVRTQKYKECERILAEDAANVYIQDLPNLVALNNKFGGYEFYPLYVMDFSKLYLK